jgi:hypothetical protein
VCGGSRMAAVPSTARRVVRPRRCGRDLTEDHCQVRVCRQDPDRGVRSPRMGRKPKIWTAVDRDYETLRIGMQTLFHHVGIETVTAAA